MIIYEEKPKPAYNTQDVSPQQIELNMQHLSEFETGVKFVINKIRTRLYYIPDEWKTGDTLTLYNIIDHALNDIEVMFLKDEEDI